MKRIISLFFFICLVSVCYAGSQETDGSNQSECQSCTQNDSRQISQNKSGSFSAQEYWKRKHEFLVEKAQLTDDEKDAFFPLYDEMYQKKHELNRKVRQQNQAVQKSCNNEEECRKALDLIAETNIRIAKLEKEYLERFKQILPASKLLKLQNADEEFNSTILKDIQKSKADAPAKPRPQSQPQPAA